MIHYILDFIGIILIVKWIKLQFKTYKSLNKKSNYFIFKRFQSLIITIIIIAIPLLLINYTNIEVVNHITQIQLKNNKRFFSIIISLLISLVWLVYIVKLDIFNKEKKRNIFFIFILGCVFTLLADIPYAIFYSYGFRDSLHALPSFIYSVFGIGLIEETIKLIPLLIILKFTKAIDEPYDYILYASCSALGFSFIENAMYLSKYGIEITNARALYATVAHMTFSSTIAYGLFLIKFKKSKLPVFLIFISFFFFAIFAHGFYDFWMINKSVGKFKGLTTLFFLATIHIWFIMKNNTINASNYYDKNKVLNNDRLKIYLTISLLGIFMLSYVYVSFVWNSKEANRFFIQSILVYGYIIFYLIATLTKFNLIEGVLKPIKIRLSYLVPKK